MQKPDSADSFGRGEEVRGDGGVRKGVSRSEKGRFCSEPGDSFSASWYKKQPIPLCKKMDCPVVLVQLLIRSLLPTTFDRSWVVPATFAGVKRRLAALFSRREGG